MNNIKEYRQEVGMSQEQLAVELEVTQQCVAKWENGEASPRADKLPKLANALGCTINDLFDTK